jgi:NAD(P)H-hydrate epimerase
VITIDRMAAVDRNAEATGVPRKQLMESSGNAVARAVRDVADAGDAVAIVAGRGDNGGDAFVAARFLEKYELTVSLLGRAETIGTDIARENWAALRAAELDTRVVTDSRELEPELELGDAAVIVDGMLGTGVSGDLREPERTAAETINDADATVVAVDVPSGMNADTGETPDVAVEADRVVTFHDAKPGLADRANLDVTVADIGIPEAAERFVGPGDLLNLERDPQSHKGDFGRVLIGGGGPYTGAPAHAGVAALRTGADLAFLRVPSAIADVERGYSMDFIVEEYPGERLQPDAVDGLLGAADERDADVVLLGPGLGDADETLDAVQEFLRRYEGRAVVDADAIQVVPDVIGETEADLVCTPHQGELAKMGGPRAEDWKKRAEQVRAFAADLDLTLLVKGAYDVISDGADTRVNRTGNPGMTVGGTGDVLAGATAALLSVLDPLEAASVAAYVNGRAGDLVIEEQGYGLLASDLQDRLPEALWEDR